MARKKPLPLIGKLPPGAKLKDYDPADVKRRQRALHVRRQARYAARREHELGAKDVTLNLTKKARENLAALAQAAGVSRTAMANTILEGARHDDKPGT